MATTTSMVARQPRCWPSRVAAGTPTTLARVSPENITDTARARRCGAASSAAATAPAPKKAPCGRPVISRATASSQKFGAIAQSRLPTVNRPARAIRTVFRGTRAATAVSSGAPITTPTA